MRYRDLVFLSFAAGIIGVIFGFMAATRIILTETGEPYVAHMIQDLRDCRDDRQENQ